jgi:parvulin-like peptidyl-prolyl isomerase
MPPQPEAFHLTYIAVASKEEAEKLRADLVAGTLTWEQAAKQYNLDPYGREKGTDLGWVPKAKLKDDIVANLQRDGDLSQVLEYGGHWAMLRREAYRAQGRPPFEQVEADLREQLTQEAAQRKLMSLMNVADIKRLGDYKQPGQ